LSCLGAFVGDAVSTAHWGEAVVITAVFIIGLLNIGMGFAIGFLLEKRIATSAVLAPAPAPLARSAPSARPASAAMNASRDPDDKLAIIGIDSDSPLEKLLWTVKLDAGQFREELVSVDRNLRASVEIGDVSQRHGELLCNWQRTLETFAAAVTEEPSTGDSCWGELEELLLDQSHDFKELGDKLSGEHAEGSEELLAIAIDRTNFLRDRIDRLIGDLLRQTERLEAIPEQLQRYPGTAGLSRLGLEVLFDQWWRDDPEHVRLVSGVLLDLDRFSLVNRHVGTAIADQILLRFVELLLQFVRTDRGFDRVAHLSADQFLLFLGDTSGKNAAHGAERIRQAIEAIRIESQGRQHGITASCGVVEIAKTETASELISRLETLVAEAKKAGRNRAFLDVGEGPQLIQLPQYRVESRIMQFDD